MPTFRVNLEMQDGGLESFNVNAPSRDDAVRDTIADREGVTIRGIEKKVGGEWKLISGDPAKVSSESIKTQYQPNRGSQLPTDPVSSIALIWIGVAEMAAGIMVAIYFMSQGLTAVGLAFIIVGITGGLLLIAAGQSVLYLHRIWRAAEACRTRVP